MARPSDVSTEEWFRRAKRYLRISGANLDMGFADSAAFYGHQASEFAFRALEIHLTGRYSRIHDLKKLSGIVSAPPRIANLAADVSPAYILSRYPEDAPRIRRAEGERILEGF